MSSVQRANSASRTGDVDAGRGRSRDPDAPCPPSSRDRRWLGEPRVIIARSRSSWRSRAVGP